MVEAGLLEVHSSGETASACVIPTQKFVALLGSYEKKFESLFILRDTLRNEQLLIQSRHTDLVHVVVTLYDHFYDLGWFYLHSFPKGAQPRNTLRSARDVEALHKGQPAI